jgi:hypothetical protein
MWFLIKGRVTMMKFVISILIMVMLSGCGTQDKPSNFILKHYKVTNHFMVSSYTLGIYDATFVGMDKKRQSVILNSGNMRYDVNNVAQAWLDVTKYANGMDGVVAHLPNRFKYSILHSIKKELTVSGAYIEVLK